MHSTGFIATKLVCLVGRVMTQFFGLSEMKFAVFSAEGIHRTGKCGSIGGGKPNHRLSPANVQLATDEGYGIRIRPHATGT